MAKKQGNWTILLKLSLVEAMEGRKVSANPQKIVAGLEPDVRSIFIIVH